MTLVSLSGAVLAGGKGERINNWDKGLIPFQGRAMAQRVIDAMSHVTDTVFINANRNIEQYREYGFDVITDLEPYRNRGPLSGLVSCLMFSETSHLLISPCDTPNITPAIFQALKTAAQQKPESIFYLQDAAGKHPLHAILPVESALYCLKHFLEREQGNSVLAFYECFGSSGIFWNASDEFLNVNTEMDIR